MAISTFSELKSSIAAWADRTDLTSTIPDFITLAESRINRRLRVREMENSASITVTSGTGSLPTGFLAVKRVIATGVSPTRVLQYADPNWYMEAFPDQDDGNDPTFYTIIGTSIYVTTNVTLIYWKSIPALSDSNTTNWLLTKAPDIYLQASLAELEGYTENPEGMAMRLQLFEAGCADLERADIMHRGTAMAMRSSSVAA